MVSPNLKAAPRSLKIAPLSRFYLNLAYEAAKIDVAKQNTSIKICVLFSQCMTAISLTTF